MVDSRENQIKTDEDDCMFAVQLATSSVMPMVLQTVIGLNIFDIIAKEGGGAHLSPRQIASHLPTQNPETPCMLDRMLRLLASHSVLTCNAVALEDGRFERRYGLATVCKYFLKAEDGSSLHPWLNFFNDRVIRECCYGLKDAVFKGGLPFHNINGMEFFEYVEKDARFNQVFNGMMSNHTVVVMKKILEVYKGFDNLNEIIDVGGGIGTMSNMIIFKYPKIKCINFDLPGVIKGASSKPGIKHVEGDMFVAIPNGEVIFMKTILHVWDDEHCLKILKNCYAALPDHGMVIVVDMVLPSENQTVNCTRGMSELDVVMMTICEGAKERTEKEFEDLAKGAGFSHIKLLSRFFNYGIIEFYK